MNRLRYALVSVCAAALLATGATTSAFAQEFPTKPIRIIIPFGPGGGTDIVTRIVGSELEKILGQPIIPENKPGAFGIVGIEQVARSEADGHTLMTGVSSSNVITPLFFKDRMTVNYDETMVPVARIAQVPMVWAVTTVDFAPRTWKEFVDHTKANPGKVRYGSTGHASFVHIDTIALGIAAGLDMAHVPATAGASGIIQALSNGDVNASIINVATAAPLVEAGRVKPIAVVWPERLPEYPDLPTFAELGFGDAVSTLWVGMFAPAGVPEAVLQKLSDAVNQALKTDSVREGLAKQHFTAVPTESPAAAKQWIAEETALWARKIEQSGLTPN